ncbi:MAG: hypothetical protein ACOYBY_04750 [Dermatophilaceae bacterium]
MATEATAPEDVTPEEDASSLRRHAAVLVVLLIVMLPQLYLSVVSTPFFEPLAVRLDKPTGIRMFTIGALAFFPGWLFIRFIAARGPALWNEYVVNLHRLGVDNVAFLPRPPQNSEYFDGWVDARRRAGRLVALPDAGSLDEAADPGCRDGTLYQVKFDAYYGRGFSRALKGDSRVSTETLFPVFLLTAVLAVGWAAILSDGWFLTQPLDSLTSDLAYAFAGAYLFNLQMLIRRFFQADLKSSAYANAFIRTVTTLIVVTVLHQAPLALAGGSYQAAVAFFVGFFPLAGLQALRRLASKGLQAALPSLQSDYPLSELDGLNLWYETRLSEEGIEDAQELITANIVDVLLHTRVPVARLVDWLDQAHLLVQLPPPPRTPGRVWGLVNRPRSTASGEGRSPGETAAKPVPVVGPRVALRRAGIRTATDLLAAFGVYRPVEGLQAQSGRPGGKRLAGPDPDELAVWVAKNCGEEPLTIHSLVTIVANRQALGPVLNWREWGSQRMADMQVVDATRTRCLPVPQHA